MVKLACPPRLMGTKQLHHNHHQRKKNALIFYLIFSTDSLRICMTISLENLYIDHGSWRVKQREDLVYNWPVLDKPVILTIIISITYHKNTMIQLGAAAGWFIIYTCMIKLERTMISINCYWNRTNRGHSWLEGIFVTRWNICITSVSCANIRSIKATITDLKKNEIKKTLVSVVCHVITSYFLPRKSIHHQEKWCDELIKWSWKEKYIDH